MTTHATAATVEPGLDLVLERTIDVPPELVWKAWTEPERLKRWFTPKPWSTVEVTIDLRPGGAFDTVMRSPEGKDYPNSGCFLEVVPGKRLVFTSALSAGFRPVPTDGSAEGTLHFTAFVTLEPHGTGTRYVARAVHGDEATCSRHEAMGFHDGWGKALDQLVEEARRRR